MKSYQPGEEGGWKSKTADKTRDESTGVCGIVPARGWMWSQRMATPAALQFAA